MKRLLLFYLGIGILISCDKKPSTSESLVNGDFKSDSVTELYPRHEISYTDSVFFSNSNIEFDTATIYIKSNDTIVSHQINPVTKQVMRFCSQRNSLDKIDHVLAGNHRIQWDTLFGFPNEFIGSYLFSDVYKGHENGGTITKHKLRVTNTKLQYVDSIEGGSYIEGAGTWQWLISNTGDPKTIMFHGGDLWSVDKSKLLITPEGSEKTYLIDLQKKDTLLFISRPDKDIRQQIILENGILFFTETKPRLGYLKFFDLKGKLNWTAKSDYLEKILVVPDKN